MKFIILTPNSIIQPLVIFLSGIRYLNITVTTASSFFVEVRTILIILLYMMQLPQLLCWLFKEVIKVYCTLLQYITYIIEGYCLLRVVDEKTMFQYENGYGIIRLLYRRLS